MSTPKPQNPKTPSKWKMSWAESRVEKLIWLNLTRAEWLESNYYINYSGIESIWDLLKPSERKLEWPSAWSRTELCQTGSDTELTTQSDITPREDTGEEQRLDSEHAVSNLWRFLSNRRTLLKFSQHLSKLGPLVPPHWFSQSAKILTALILT